ncbi:uncharacterized protein Pyn_00243 [Prunus yedoensis var. nudiflora]|uniref:Uncharacterized protein n=1 Tax=Prunus yedoensis var. nudiflora TaxID=2094558 RepID=A0A314YUC7_PRUYE|nr:uncharacterized protein Pyn_00243 [Prunus yedoensis var. nudiflora]
MVVEEVGAAEAAVEEAATTEEEVEMQDAEVASAEVLLVEETAEEAAEELAEEAAEEAAEDAADEGGEEAIEEAAEEAIEEAAEEATEEAAVDVPIEPLPSAPRCPSGIAFRSPPQSSPLSMVAVTMPPAPLSQDSMVVTEPVATGAPVVSVPSLLQTTSAVMTELSLAEPTSSEDLEELYASLHEEGGSSALAPLDEDSKTIVERLREFLLLGVHEMIAAGAIMEFRSCLDTAMALGLLDSAQLDELQARLAEGEEMIGRYAEAVARMAEGNSLEQDLVEAQIAELQARRDLILQRRDGAVAAGNELKSSAKQILKAATETKKALAERKLIRARWQADINGGDLAWRRITCLIWGMFSEGV